MKKLYKSKRCTIKLFGDDEFILWLDNTEDEVVVCQIMTRDELNKMYEILGKLLNK